MRSSNVWDSGMNYSKDIGFLGGISKVQQKRQIKQNRLPKKGNEKRAKTDKK